MVDHIKTFDPSTAQSKLQNRAAVSKFVYASDGIVRLTGGYPSYGSNWEPGGSTAWKKCWYCALSFGSGGTFCITGLVASPSDPDFVPVKYLYNEDIYRNVLISSSLYGSSPGNGFDKDVWLPPQTGAVLIYHPSLLRWYVHLDKQFSSTIRLVDNSGTSPSNFPTSSLESFIKASGCIVTRALAADGQITSFAFQTGVFYPIYVGAEQVRTFHVDPSSPSGYKILHNYGSGGTNSRYIICARGVDELIRPGEGGIMTYNPTADKYFFAKIPIEFQQWAATVSGAGTYTLVTGKINKYSAGAGVILHLPAAPSDGDEVPVKEVGNSATGVTLTTAAGTVNIEPVAGGALVTSDTLNAARAAVTYKWDNTDSVWYIARKAFI